MLYRGETGTRNLPALRALSNRPIIERIEKDVESVSAGFKISP